MKVRYQPPEGNERSKVKILSYEFDFGEEKEVSDEDAKLILTNQNFKKVESSIFRKKKEKEGSDN